MKNFLTATAFYVSFFYIEDVNAQQTFGFGFMNYAKEQCVSAEQTRFIEQEISKNQKKLRLATTNIDPVLFDFPLRQKGVNDYSYYAISNFVDLDASRLTRLQLRNSHLQRAQWHGFFYPTVWLI